MSYSYIFHNCLSTLTVPTKNKKQKSTKKPKATKRTTTRRPTTTRRVWTTKPTSRRVWTTKPTTRRTTPKPVYNVQKNPKNGWTYWTSWTDCSRTCGGGVQYRERTCENQCPSQRAGQMLTWHQDPRGCGREQCPVGSRSYWGNWGVWGRCDKECGRGSQTRYVTCLSGACKHETASSFPSQTKPCQIEPYCPQWENWAAWGECSALCSGGTKLRNRICKTGKPGFEGCPGPDFENVNCNGQTCASNEARYSDFNDVGMPRVDTKKISLRPFHQECIDYHNFFRALHNLKPMTWEPTIAASAQKWASELKVRAPKTPNESRQRTSHWPHSDSPSQFRAKNVGENIAWDLTENGHPCKESVYRLG